MKKTFKCPHIEIEVFGCDQEVYCKQCKSLIFSVEETERQERIINKNKQK